MKKYLFIVLLVGVCFGQLSTNFKYAKVGDYYEIVGNSGLVLLKNPKLSESEAELKSNLITVLGVGVFNIEILKTKGFFDRFYNVHVIGHGKIKFNGWIWSGGVSGYKKISKDSAYFVEPITTYSPDKKSINKALEKNKDEVILGKWLNHNMSIGAIWVIKEKIVNGRKKFIREINWKEGGKSEDPVKVKKVANKVRIDFPDSGTGEYYIINSDGDLEIYDNDGYFQTFKAINK